jgi:hypothetical protein
MIPAEDSPSRLFDQIFFDESESERIKQAQRVREGRSIMDLVQEDARKLKRELGKGDQQRLDAFFTSVRDLENRMRASEEWDHRPKPGVSVDKPVDIGNSNDFVGRQRLMSDMIHLALQTDSSRFIVYHLGGSGGVVPIAGVEEGYHSLSHHGLDEEKLEQLALVESEIIRAWGDYIGKLNGTDDQGRSLLDQTSVLLTRLSTSQPIRQPDTENGTRSGSLYQWYEYDEWPRALIRRLNSAKRNSASWPTPRKKCDLDSMASIDSWRSRFGASIPMGKP